MVFSDYCLLEGWGLQDFPDTLDFPDFSELSERGPGCLGYPMIPYLVSENFRLSPKSCVVVG